MGISIREEDVDEQYQSNGSVIRHHTESLLSEDDEEEENIHLMTNPLDSSTNEKRKKQKDQADDILLKELQTTNMPHMITKEAIQAHHMASLNRPQTVNQQQENRPTRVYA